MPNFERNMPPGMAPKGTRFWRAAELSGPIPWYAVTLEEGDGEARAIRNFLVTDDRDVVSLAEQSSMGTLLALKQMITAPHEMLERAWDARDIVRVWLGVRVLRGTPEGILFEDVNGRFSNGLGPVVRPAKRDLELVFQLQSAAHPG